MRIITPEKLSEKEQGYVLGLFIGDGYSNFNKKDRHYTVSFFLNSLRDGDIQERIVGIIDKFSLVSKVSKDPRYNVNKIRVYSKEFFYLLRTQENKLLTKPLTTFKKEFLLGVISGFIDAEGYVGHGMITITQKDFTIMSVMKQICELLKIVCRVRTTVNKYGEWILRGDIATSFKYLPHYSKKVERKYGCPS